MGGDFAVRREQLSLRPFNYLIKNKIFDTKPNAFEILSTKIKGNIYVNQVYFVSCHISFLFYLNTQSPVRASNKKVSSFNYCLPFMTI